MKPNLKYAFWMVVPTLLYACAGGFYSDGHRAYLDTNGEVVRAYPADHGQTVQAVREALMDIGVSILDQHRADGETIIAAVTPDGSPLRIRFIREGRNLTVVRVRTGHLGFKDQEYSSQLHAFLAARLDRRSGPPTPAAEPAAAERAPAAPQTQAMKAAATEAAAPSPPSRATEDVMPPSQDAEIKAPSTPLASPPEVNSGPAAPQASEPPEAAPKAPAPVAMLKDPGQPEPDFIIFFEKDSNIVPPQAMAILDQAAGRMQAFRDAVIDLRGYADLEEDPDAFHLVSESRALAIKSYLIGKGIASGRIRATWHGSRQANPSFKDPSRQRRVEIRLIRGL
jgi:OOP family OmpA-OmpF porin